MEIIDSEILYDSFFSQNHHKYLQQDQQIGKFFKYGIFFFTVGTTVSFLFPLVHVNAKELLKEKINEKFITTDGLEFQKLFQQIDYRPNKTVKNVVKKVVKQIVTSSNSITGTIEFGQVIDLTPFFEKLFSTQGTVEIIDLPPQQKLFVVQKVLSSFQQLNQYLYANRIALIRGGFFGIGLGQLQAAKKTFDIFQSFLPNKNEQKEREDDEKNNNLFKTLLIGTGTKITGLLSNPYLLLSFLGIYLVKGKFPFPETAQQYDQLPVPVKPLFKKPSKTQRFLDYYIKPIYNFKSPLPYVIIGSIILYFYKGQIIAFITQKSEARTAFGELASIMMNQLKNQFSEFVAFVKSTNSVFTEQIKNNQKEYTETIKENKQELKQNLQEQKENLKNVQAELKYCSLNKEKITLGLQECSLKYNYARTYFENNLLKSNSHTVGDISVGIEQAAKQEAERILPTLQQDVQPIPIPENIKKNK